MNGIHRLSYRSHGDADPGKVKDHKMEKQQMDTEVPGMNESKTPAMVRDGQKPPGDLAARIGDHVETNRGSCQGHQEPKPRGGTLIPPESVPVCFPKPPQHDTMGSLSLIKGAKKEGTQCGDDS